MLDYLTTHTSLSPIQRGFAPGFVHYKKGCTRLAATSDKAYQLLAHGWWFSPGTPASSTTKTGRCFCWVFLLAIFLCRIYLKLYGNIIINVCTNILHNPMEVIINKLLVSKIFFLIL
jgi:hypothetical protein